nr:MAG TPA: tail protein [Bacteriophage sp.]
MSIQTEITRLQAARNKIRTKLVALGLATSTAKMDALADAIDEIENNGAVSASVQEGSSYTIPKGYHNGSGTVSGVSGGGNYSLQAKSITPTKKQQSIAPDAGYYGLSAVTVGAIPDNYQDTSPVTAGAGDVLANKVIVNADGETVAGTMPNNGAVSKTLDAATKSYTVPAGYHDGTGKVQIVTEEKTATPTKAAQEITPATGKVLSKVSIGAIPANYIDTSDADALAANILEDKTAYVDGAKVTGTMANNGAISKTIDGLNVTSYTVPAGYTSGGSVALTNDIETALAAI